MTQAPALIFLNTLSQEAGPAASAPRALLISALVCGVILWLFGHKSLRAGFGLLGALAGGIAGFALTGALGLPIHPGIVAAVGAIGGLVIGLVTFRISIGLILAGVLATVGAGTVFAFVAPDQARALRDDPFASPATEPGPEISASVVPDSAAEPNEPTDEAVAKVRDWLKEKGMSESGAASAAQDLGQTGQLVTETSDKVRDAGERLADRVRPMWNSLSRENRTAVALGALAGASIGLGIGLFFPKRSASTVTAGAGVLLWLPAAVALADRAGWQFPASEWLHREPQAWALIWLVLAVIGTCIQWAMTKRRADKP